MNIDWQQYIDRYLDEDLSHAEFLRFQEWLAADPAHMRRLAESAMMHDRLQGLMLARAAMSSVDHREELKSRVIEKSFRSIPKRIAILLTLATTILFGFVFWRGSAPVFAAQIELQKMITAHSLLTDRVYLIEVESSDIGGARQRRKPADQARPPKPPMDDAKLYIRGKNMFVLERVLPTGEYFVTGSDGNESWAVPPAGSVRVSSNLQEFSRDVPGHEYSMSLCNLSDALSQLSMAYQINLLPLDQDGPSSMASEPTRLLVASKKSGFRGPRRVEITYSQDSRLIEQIRFVDMPYGADRLTIRMALADQNALPTHFFEHKSHHSGDREVIRE